MAIVDFQKVEHPYTDSAYRLLTREGVAAAERVGGLHPLSAVPGRSLLAVGSVVVVAERYLVAAGARGEGGES